MQSGYNVKLPVFNINDINCIPIITLFLAGITFIFLLLKYGSLRISTIRAAADGSIAIYSGSTCALSMKSFKSVTYSFVVCCGALFNAGELLLNCFLASLPL